MYISAIIMYTRIYFTNYFTLFFCLLLQVLGVGIVVAALIGFLESIAISKAFGNYSRKDILIFQSVCAKIIHSEHHMQVSIV